MKIGIITFHRAVNYGAVLQTYALQKKLQEYGVEVEVIDYRCGYLENNYKPFTILKRASNFKGLVAMLLKVFPSSVRKKHNFDKFLKEYINLSKGYDQNSIGEANDIYDIFITGSDQVWNYHHTNFDENYFLKFVDDNAKKYSYAASFGFVALPSDMVEKYKVLLKDFRALSVREKSAQTIIKNLLRKNISVVVDPVFLLTKDEWEDMASSNRVIKEKYILVYELMKSESLFNFALKLQLKTGYKIVRISTMREKMKNVIFKGTDRPEIFLNYIKNAEYVVTNSFHGTAFSIIFNKQFAVEYLKDSMSSLNTRLIDLLTEYGLQNRVINHENVYNPIVYKTSDIHSIKYNNSIKFLKNMLEEHSGKSL